MNWATAALAAAAAGCLAPVCAGWVRHRSGLVWATTLAASVCLGAFFFVLHRFLAAEGFERMTPWMFALAAFGVPLVLSAYLVTGAVGREDAVRALRSRRGTFLLLAVAGVVFLALLRHPAFLVGYRTGEGGLILLGAVGKAYLSYLLVGTVVAGYNLENTYRLSSGAGRERLRPALLGIFAVLGYAVFMLSMALLYGAVRVPALVALSVPVLLGGLLTAYGYLRGSLTDASVPVSRNVVYTSFTAFVAAMYVVAVGIIAQLASVLHFSPTQAVSLAMGFVIVAGALALLLSRRLQRTVRRFIDRNFYVNRYDYRMQWFRVTRSLDASEGQDGLLRDTAALVRDVLRADDVTVSLFDRSTDSYRVVLGKGRAEGVLLLSDSSPLAAKLRSERRSLLLDRHPEDFEYIPIYVEEREWLDVTASRVVAPLLAGTELLGLVGLDRAHPADRFTYEDLDLLDSLTAHVAAVLRTSQLSRELDDAREMELLSQWSGMLLHDLKNQLSPLRLLVHNLRRNGDDPEFQRVAVEDLTRITGEMETLVRRLGELRAEPPAAGAEVGLAGAVRASVSRLRLDRREGIELRVDLAEVFCTGDETLLRRVVENLLLNAAEALDGDGRVTVRLRAVERQGAQLAELTVADTGCGMDPEFVRTRLFRPFATTKRQGLGLGLYQCASIVRAHGGELTVRSEPGRGSTFRLRLPGRAEMPRGVAAGAGMGSAR